ncbi:MAG: hypothetical protein P1V20_31780 [Verrucomicrobiales bacterium]|nr:hypothetical protein [Verrucomicrobiales bacterium]
MNPVSLLFSLFVFALFAATAGLIWWGAKRNSHWSIRRRKITCGGLLGLAFVAAVFAYKTDSHQRAVTLFETKFDWQDLPVKKWSIAVENPGSEHTMRLMPMAKPFRQAKSPVTLRIRFRQMDGQILFEKEVKFHTETETGKNSATREVWESHKFTFSPAEESIHQLEIEPVGPPPPVLFVRIEDPLKTDGKRTAGY